MCHPCYETGSDCDCHDEIFKTGENTQPLSQTIGTPSSTGFGSMTPITAQPTFASSPAQPLTTKRSVNTEQLPSVNVDPLINQPLQTTVHPEIGYPPNTSVTPLHGNDYNIPESYPTASPTVNPLVPLETMNSILNETIMPPVSQPSVPDIVPNSENSPATLPPSGNSPTESTPSGTTSEIPHNRTTTKTGHLPMPVGIPRHDNSQPSRGESTNRANPLLLDLNSGSISLTVPENAQVFINGYETKIQGTKRTYIVNNLIAEKQYDYHVRIAAIENGQFVEKNHRLSLIGGRQNSVAYDWFAPANDRVYVAVRPIH
jgi:uncharacterized protein (TIGR03000 family)